ncbi:hypothetical protein [Bradyrhizobium valentinum]|uniref:Uncharacterized protein n=1 Tax=Bradyrhizobium valentinum TaxID=1518501 RepID=A0A0R3KV14_9BRAD|nr:hypothetical protein [Bradyrhizobium valentinum]KRQ99267.1 hypothetical protein CP49_11765 [Bradyrhizobium valentinum]
MSAYVKTETKYGRPEQSLDIHRFARDLAKAIGGKVIPQKPGEIPNERYASIELDGAAISFTAGWGRNEIEKVSVRISALGLNLSYNDMPRGPEFKTPEAKVSTARPLAAIAADIKRRVIDPGKAPIEKLREHAAACDRQRTDLRATADQLRKRYPGLSVTVKDDARHSATFYRNDNKGPYLSGSVGPDGSASIERIGSLTPEQFARVMAALYPVDAKERR